MSNAWTNFDRENKKALIAIVAGTLILLAVVFGVWFVSSHFEAKAFNRVTGKKVTTWEAMFIQLRVQEGAKDE